MTSQPLNSREITPLPHEERGKCDLRDGLDFLEVRKTFYTIKSLVYVSTTNIYFKSVVMTYTSDFIVYFVTALRDALSKKRKRVTEKLFAYTGIRTPDRQARILITIPTAPCRLPRCSEDKY